MIDRGGEEATDSKSFRSLFDERILGLLGRFVRRSERSRCNLSLGCLFVFSQSSFLGIMAEGGEYTIGDTTFEASIKLEDR